MLWVCLLIKLLGLGLGLCSGIADMCFFVFVGSCLLVLGVRLEFCVCVLLWFRVVGFTCFSDFLWFCGFYVVMRAWMGVSLKGDTLH